MFDDDLPSAEDEILREIEEEELFIEFNHLRFNNKDIGYYEYL